MATKGKTQGKPLATGRKIPGEKKRPEGRNGTQSSRTEPSPIGTVDPESSPIAGDQGRDRIAEFMALSASVMASHVFGKPEVWLNSPNPHFGGLTPNEMIEGGQEDRVQNLLAALTLGLF